jgi:hypothetical protein
MQKSDFCCKEHFVKRTQHKKLLSHLGAFYTFVRSTQQLKNCFLVSGHFMQWRFITPRGVIGFIVSGTFIKRMIPTRFQSRSASGYIYLCLLSGKTLRFSTSRPGICMLACRIRALGFLVYVYPFLTNTFESIHLAVWRYIVMIPDTLLIIIPPVAVHHGPIHLDLPQMHLKG